MHIFPFDILNILKQTLVSNTAGKLWNVFAYDKHSVCMIIVAKENEHVTVADRFLFLSSQNEDKGSRFILILLSG